MIVSAGGYQTTKVECRVTFLEVTEVPGHVSSPIRDLGCTPEITIVVSTTTTADTKQQQERENLYLVWLIEYATKGKMQELPRLVRQRPFHLLLLLVHCLPEIISLHLSMALADVVVGDVEAFVEGVVLIQEGTFEGITDEVDCSCVGSSVNLVVSPRKFP